MILRDNAPVLVEEECNSIPNKPTRNIDDFFSIHMGHTFD
jgi:hypothetical protein